MNPFPFPIDRGEVLRYLGYQGQPLEDPLSSQLDKARDAIRAVSRPLWVRRTFPICRTEQGIVPQGTALCLTGEGIARHLAGCDRLVLMAATLGVQAEKTIKYLELTDLTLCAMADAAATTAVEELCDWAEDSIRREAAREGLYATGRFSPGYGDLPISLQRGFVQVLDAQKAIGLSVSGAGILLPRKSVTAVIGLSSRPVSTKGRGCDHCPNREGCPYQKRGEDCASATPITE